MDLISNILVVGAGPAGLSTAVALRRQGVEVHLIDIAPERTTLGSELLISSPALRALDELGVADRVAENGTEINTVRTYDADGAQLVEMPIQTITRPDLPPAVGISRSRLHEAILEEAKAHGVRVRHETTLSALTESPGGVTATLSDGTEATYGLVVGADGVRSPLRARVFPEVKPEYTGQMVWRARVPRKTAGALEGYAGAGNKNHSGYVPVADDTAYIFCVVPRPSIERLPPMRFPELLREELVDCTGTIGWARDRLGGPETINYAPVMALNMAPPWHVGRVVLIGDAVHATPPQVGYGAGLAIEDGVVLGESLTTAATVDDALKAFAYRRRERCQLVVESALTLCRWQQQPDPSVHPGQVFMRVWDVLNEPI